MDATTGTCPRGDISDARRALLSKFFDHAPMFPPANLPPAEALSEDRHARESEHAWLLGRLVWPAAQLAELPQDEDRALALATGIPSARTRRSTWRAFRSTRSRRGDCARRSAAAA